jgi:hypothetical protein
MLDGEMLDGEMLDGEMLDGEMLDGALAFKEKMLVTIQPAQRYSSSRNGEGNGQLD